MLLITVVYRTAGSEMQTVQSQISSHSSLAKAFIFTNQLGNEEKMNSGYTVTHSTWACKPTTVALNAFETGFEEI